MELIRRNSRGGAFAVRVIAGLVDEDLNVWLLSGKPGEHEGDVNQREGTTDHCRRVSSIWLRTDTHGPCRLIYTSVDLQRHSVTVVEIHLTPDLQRHSRGRRSDENRSRRIPSRG